MAMAAIQAHNESVLNYLEAGDLVQFKRCALYSHWAVYVGNKRVVHMTARENDRLNANSNSGPIFTICGARFRKADVTEENFWDVTNDSRAYKNNGKDWKIIPDARANIVDRALSRLGDIEYNVLWYNCEHFASWCRYGVAWSEQADTFFKWATFLSIGAVLSGWFYYRSGRREDRSGRREDRRTQ